MSELTPAEPFRHRLITDAGEARAALRDFLREPVLGLDTETFWDAKSGWSNLSLAQFARPDGEAIVVDALATGVEPLREVVESESVLLVAHNARFDEAVLAGAGLSPAGLVDTLRMARMGLTLDSYSLASVSEHLLGLPLDKTLQKSNWRRRPLTKAQIAYAAKDAHIVLRVFEELRAKFEAEGTFAGALLAAKLGPPAAAREKRKRRPAEPISPPLTKEEKGVVTRLKRWRLERANQQRVPAYMICPDKTLEHLARSRPATLDALKEVYGMGESKVARFGDALLEALKAACVESPPKGGGEK
ncbi:MAG TPA: HRDC domain-containing protein [Pyrinomonadaceae bacterium]|nr:HRDC domain-containing protein [Pyrinomonadaceae bacterium]